MMSATVTADDRIVRVKGYKVREALRRYRLKPISVAGCWVLDRDRLGDVLAALEREHYVVHLEDTAQAERAAPTEHPAKPWPVEDEIAGLW